jgi:hypothetical protein
VIRRKKVDIPLPELSDIQGATGLDLILTDIDGVEVQVPVHVDIDPENYVDVYTLVLVNPPNVVNVDVQVDVPDTNTDVAVVVDGETVLVDVIVMTRNVYVASSTEVNDDGEKVIQDVLVTVKDIDYADVSVDVNDDSKCVDVKVKGVTMFNFDPDGLACSD